MKALLLAAGEGTRLRPLTYQIPKPLIDVCGRPIVQYSLEQVKDSVDEFILVVGYKADQIKAHFGNEFKGVKMSYVIQEEQLGTGHAVNCAREHLEGEDRFVLLMGDNIYSKKDVHSCMDEDGLCLLASEVKEPRKFGIVVTDGQGYVRQIIEKPDNPPSNLANTALYVLGGKIFNEIDKLKKSERGEFDLPEAAVNLGREQPIRCIKATGMWIPVGYPEELELARNIISEREDEFV